MITYSDPAGPRGIVTATVFFPWPVNETSSKTLRAMQEAAVAALTAAGTPTVKRPEFHDVRPAEGGGYTFQFTAPVAQPEPTPEVTP